MLYDDDFTVAAAEHLAATGQVADDGARLVANTESNGRFHSKWLSMIYPRLRLARTLMREDGILAVSINDAEAPRLRQVLDEIFGERNFLAQLIWMKGKEGGNDNNGFGQHHEYIVVYARDKAVGAAAIALDDKDTSRHRTELPEANLVTPGDTVYREGEPFQLINLSKQKDYVVTIPLADGSELEWPSYAPQSTIDEFVRMSKLFVGSKGVPYVKSFLADEATGTKPSTLITSEWGTTKAGGIAVRELFGVSKMFTYPKPPRLISRLMQICGVSDNDIVMDLFAGSGSTAQAVFESNATDEGSRRFILVQAAEPIPAGSNAAKEGFSDIAQLARERIRRSGAKGSPEGTIEGWRADVGFRAFRIDTTGMADVLRTPDQVQQDELALYAGSVKPDRTGDDLLFEVLHSWGLDLALPVVTESISGSPIFVVDDGTLVACFAETVSPEIVSAVAERLPLRAVFRDSAFASDADRINAEQIFAERTPGTDLKAI